MLESVCLLVTLRKYMSGSSPGLGHFMLQIEQAARGCISGDLSEWPLLRKELGDLGIILPLDTQARTLTKICKLIMGSCEKCWRDAGGDAFRYRELLQEQKCSPEEQAGPEAKHCPDCGRQSIHMYTGMCTSCGWHPDLENIG